MAKARKGGKKAEGPEAVGQDLSASRTASVRGREAGQGRLTRETP
jgi:hypothetical protein